MLFTVLFFLVLVLSPRVVNTKAFIFGISMCEADARAYGRFFFIDLYQIFDNFFLIETYIWEELLKTNYVKVR